MIQYSITRNDLREHLWSRVYVKMSSTVSLQAKKLFKHIVNDVQEKIKKEGINYEET